jgi:hypothetical protein
VEPGRPSATKDCGEGGRERRKNGEGVIYVYVGASAAFDGLLMVARAFSVCRVLPAARSGPTGPPTFQHDATAEAV